MALDKFLTPQGDTQFDRGKERSGGCFDVLNLHRERNNLDFQPNGDSSMKHLPGLTLVDSAAEARDAAIAQQTELVRAQESLMRTMMQLAMLIQRMNPEQLKLFGELMRNLMLGGQQGDGGNGGGGDHPTRPPEGGGGDRPTRPGTGGGDHPTKPGNGGGDHPPAKPGGGDKPTKPGGNDHPTKPGGDDHNDGSDKPVHPPDPKPTNGKVIWRVDADHPPSSDKNISYSMDDNKHNAGGSSVKIKHDDDGKGYINFKVNRWPDLPEGWEKNPPANVSPEQLKQMKEAVSYRAELTSYQEEDRFKPGHTYEIKFDNQLAKWDSDKSVWGDIFFQMHQSAPYGVPEFAIGTRQNKYGLLLNGHWKELDLPPVDKTVGDWQDWKVKMSMPKEDGSGGKVEVMHDGKVVYTDNDWELKTGYKQGNPYVKVGIYKAVYHEDENGKYTGTGGSRHRELNVGSFSVSDVT